MSMRPTRQAGALQLAARSPNAALISFTVTRPRRRARALPQLRRPAPPHATLSRAATSFAQSGWTVHVPPSPSAAAASCVVASQRARALRRRWTSPPKNARGGRRASALTQKWRCAPLLCARRRARRRLRRARSRRGLPHRPRPRPRRHSSARLPGQLPEAAARPLHACRARACAAGRPGARAEADEAGGARALPPLPLRLRPVPRPRRRGGEGQRHLRRRLPAGGRGVRAGRCRRRCCRRRRRRRAPASRPRRSGARAAPSTAPTICGRRARRPSTAAARRRARCSRRTLSATLTTPPRPRRPRRRWSRRPTRRRRSSATSSSPRRARRLAQPLSGAANATGGCALGEPLEGTELRGCVIDACRARPTLEAAAAACGELGAACGGVVRDQSRGGYELRAAGAPAERAGATLWPLRCVSRLSTTRWEVRVRATRRRWARPSGRRRGRRCSTIARRAAQVRASRVRTPSPSPPPMRRRRWRRRRPRAARGAPARPRRPSSRGCVLR